MIGIDQYGTVYKNLGPHPRKALLERLDRAHAERIYIDKRNGPPVHVGYYIAGRWISLYTAWERPA